MLAAELLEMAAAVGLPAKGCGAILSRYPETSRLRLALVALAARPALVGALVGHRNSVARLQKGAATALQTGGAILAAVN